ncbi:hypothetical protein ACQCU1_12640 [Sutcliffiella horikoshii]|uniref:hypothetical protein n=1 Tax=Sutcliffiella horikoshii TaxID=79883 RepID=UPI003CF9783A
MDILDAVYQVLKVDPYISEQIENRIKFYEYPESGAVDRPYMVLEEVQPSQPSTFADGTWLTLDIHLHVEIWSPNRTITRLLAERVQNLVWKKFKIGQRGGLPEYDNGVYRDARRYQGLIYRNDLNQL